VKAGLPVPIYSPKRRFIPDVRLRPHWSTTRPVQLVELDPWNTLDHERGGLSETDDVCNVLTKVIRLAQANGPRAVASDRHPRRPDGHGS